MIVAELCPPTSPRPYSAYVPARLNDDFSTWAFIDSGNTFCNVMSKGLFDALGMQLDSLEPTPSIRSVGTACKGQQMKVLGQAPRLSLRFGPTKRTFVIRPLVLEGLVHPLNICGSFLQQHGIDQLHSSQSLSVDGKLVPFLNPPPTTGKDTVCRLAVELDNGPIRPALTSSPKASTLPAHPVRSVRIPPGATRHVQLKPVYLLPTGSPVLAEICETDESRVDFTHPFLGIQNISEKGTLTIPITNFTDSPRVLDKTVTYRVSPLEGDTSKPRLYENHFQKVAVTPTSKKTGDETSPPSKVADPKSHQEFSRWPSKKKISWLVHRFRFNESRLLRSDPQLRKDVLRLLLEFQDCLSIGGYGSTTLVEHEIILEKGSRPIKLRCRPLNEVMTASLQKQIDKWMKEDVIELSQSPWGFPLVPVPKKGTDKIRWAVDYRQLNNITVKDSFAIPHLQDNLSRLSGSRIFTALDGAGAFHAVPLHPEDKEKTTFTSPLGTYQFKKMPFGLVNAPATYARLVQKTLSHLPSNQVLCYLDDTAIHTKDIESHLTVLRDVFQAFRYAGLTISPEKAQLFQDEIQYLGHRISARGISVPPQYIKIITDWPMPTCLRTLRSFLGKCGYYRRFLNNYTQLISPLAKYVQQSWHSRIPQLPEDPKAVASFQQIKEALTSAPILAFPQFHGSEFILDTDFSCHHGCIGAVLSQVQDGEERVIAYGARKLNDRQKAYASCKGELLAAIFFMQHFKYYLLYRPFLLRTDNRALKWIRSMDNPTGMILRWLEVLSCFDFRVQHRAGKKHSNADALSRTDHAPFPLNQAEKDLLDSDEPLVAPVVPPDPEQRITLSWIPNRTGVIKTAQQTDPDLQKILSLRGRDDIPPEELRRLNNRQRYLKARMEHLELDPPTRLWMHVENQRRRVYIPESCEEEVIYTAHTHLAHSGAERTAWFCKDRVFIPRLFARCSQVVRECNVCQAKDKKAPRQREVYQPSVQAGAPFRVWSMDILGPYSQSPISGHRHILTFKCVFSKWVEAYPIGEPTTARVLQKIMDLIARFSFPESIHCDNASYFKSNLMDESLRTLGVRMTHIPVWNPQSNSVERAHKDLAIMIRALCHERGAPPEDPTENWESVLPAALLAMRSATSSASGTSPFYCIYGREASTPIELVFGLPVQEYREVSDHTRRLAQNFSRAHAAVSQNLDKALCRTADRYAQRETEAFPNGSRVWLYTPVSTKNRKFAIAFTGPWKVVDSPSKVLRTLEPVGHWATNAPRPVVSINRLKVAYGNRPATATTAATSHFETEDEDFEGPFRIPNLDADTARGSLNQEPGRVPANLEMTGEHHDPSHHDERLHREAKRRKLLNDEAQIHLHLSEESQPPRRSTEPHLPNFPVSPIPRPINQPLSINIPMHSTPLEASELTSTQNPLPSISTDPKLKAKPVVLMEKLPTVVEEDEPPDSIPNTPAAEPPARVTTENVRNAPEDDPTTSPPSTLPPTPSPEPTSTPASIPSDIPPPLSETLPNDPSIYANDPDIYARMVYQDESMPLAEEPDDNDVDRNVEPVPVPQRYDLRRPNPLPVRVTYNNRGRRPRGRPRTRRTHMSPPPPPQPEDMELEYYDHHGANQPHQPDGFG